MNGYLYDETTYSELFNLIYPIGIIIELATNANPKDLFGIGEWEQIKDRFILAAGDSTTAGSTGGSSTHVHSTANHTLTISQMPQHNHRLSFLNYGTGNHGYVNYTYTGDSSKQGFDYNGAGYIEYVGGSQPHNHGNTGSSSNMPPYYVAYLWRRVS